MCEVSSKVFRRTFLAFLAVFSLLGSNISLSHAEVKESESWVTPDRYDPGFQGILVSDLINAQQIFSILRANSSKPVNGSSYLCKNVNDVNCKDAESFWFNALLPKCSENSDTDCVNGITARDSSGIAQSAKFLSYVYPNHINRFEPAQTLKIPEAAQPSIWQLPDFPHKGGDQYALISGLSGTTSVKNPQAPESFYAHFIPVQRVTTDWVPQLSPSKDDFSFFYPQCITKSPGSSGEARIGCKGMVDQGIGKAQYRCVLWVDEGSDCYIQRPFASDSTFTIDFRLTAEISGWLHGRLKQPSISISRGSDNSTEVSISGQPLAVPVYYSGDKYLNLPEKIKVAYASQGHLSPGGGYGRICCEVIIDPLLRNSTSTPYPFGSESISELQLWLENVSDKAVATPSLWSVRTMNSWELNSSSQCFRTGNNFKGIVATNSTTYSQGPPEFRDNFLNYRVASPHLNQLDEVFKGSYNLIVRSDVARCLYGFSTAPISAKIEVTSESGVSNIATTVFRESDGWIYLSASNFTFSSPIIRTELTQSPEKSTEPRSEAVLPKKEETSTATILIEQSAPQVKPAKKATINCIKGKTSKKVIGTNPKCPKGFKKR